uniref:fukutin n=1 Tax=Ciona intestinalis TaxID=7719 RepID=UPI000180C4C6|nr:fukutin [Ciona intestinalis]|eukprot:XP_002120943.1 fukutin [Ciona intestinalis]
MMDLLKQIQSMKVKTFLTIVGGLWLAALTMTYIYVETYEFTKISDDSVIHQKECLDNFLKVFEDHKIPMILFDTDILPRLFQSMPRSWHDSEHKCKTLCKFHPEEKNVITFAIQGTKFHGLEESIQKELNRRGFTTHITMVADPRYQEKGKPTLIPSYFWAAKKDHVIHIAFLYDRMTTYLWLAPVSPKDWKDTVDVLAPALSDGWHSMERIGAKFPTYAQAIDKGSHFLSFPLTIDGHKISVPYHIDKFLKQYKTSRFIECNHKRAQHFKDKFESKLTEKDKNFKASAKKVVATAKKVLDKLNIPFWLSSGTCLGWFRQCDIIPYSVDVDFGVRIEDYDPKLIKRMERAGLPLKNKFGFQNDSFELSFISEEGVKLDIFFFYESKNFMWNGGTQAHDGRKYKYLFPKITLCWTEFVGLKVRIPCEARSYIEANYGHNWMVPVKQWQWNLSPPNVVTNGKWEDSEMEEAVQIYEIDFTKIKKKKKDDEDHEEDYDDYDDEEDAPPAQ